MSKYKRFVTLTLTDMLEDWLNQKFPLGLCTVTWEKQFGYHIKEIIARNDEEAHLIEINVYEDYVVLKIFTSYIDGAITRWYSTEHWSKQPILQINKIGKCDFEVTGLFTEANKQLPIPYDVHFKLEISEHPPQQKRLI